MTFTRPLNATEDNDLSLTQCRRFLFGWGGEADVVTKVIGYHSQLPVASEGTICFMPPEVCPGENTCVRLEQCSRLKKSLEHICSKCILV